jgi:hypothetical protein
MIDPGTTDAFMLSVTVNPVEPWASERTSFQNEIVEAALAHIIGNKVEEAYRRCVGRLLREACADPKNGCPPSLRV